MYERILLFNFQYKILYINIRIRINIMIQWMI